MKNTLIFLVLTILVACQNRNERTVDRFKTNPKGLEKLLIEANMDPVLVSNPGKLVSIQKLKPETINAIKTLGVRSPRYLVLDQIPCNGKYEVELIFGKNQHLNYSCDGLQSDKFESGFVQGFKINERWYYWRNNDVIG